ncbi:MAG: 3-deoxy-7-phosphoheptulonate synthase [Lachnospiraceae bacterium]|nr:3-deoxy-7-phosphoheptulonate synthase [Lachnospiraceae bacterium]MBQ9935872.1 3-deoxy-7-phosphoheptulonate synthase [Lachnospiraceae bacterium]
MSIKIIQKLPTEDELKSEIPLSEKLKIIKENRDAEIKKVFTGESDKFLFIIGPCSADSEEPVMDYIHRLASIQEKIKDKILIIPRIYTGKPRTTGAGYKGMVHQPDPSKKTDMAEGLIAIRKLHLRAIAETGMAAADEMLYAENTRYVDDLIAYHAVGARSVEDQMHRLTASGIDVPVGMKNPTSGDYTVMLNSCLAGQTSHMFSYKGYQVETSGNPYTHCILRGGLDKYGKSMSNYHYDDLVRLVDEYTKFNITNPACIVDANHNNSGKKWAEQPRIVKEVLHSCRHNDDIKNLVKGVMIESYIEDGNQAIGDGVYGKSITDPCLGWEKTEKLLLEVADLL